MNDMTPVQQAAAERAIAVVRSVIAGAYEKLIKKEEFAGVLDGLRAALTAVRPGFVLLEHRVRLVRSQKNPNAIVPANLYTALLLAGVWVEPDDGNDAVGQYLDENGVRYQWDYQAEKLCMWPVKPMEYISVSFTVGVGGVAGAAVEWQGAHPK